MSQVNSISSLSSKKLHNNLQSTMAQNELHKSTSESLKSIQLSSQTHVILSDISKSNLLSSENLEQLERSRNNLSRMSFNYESQSLINRYSSSNSTASNRSSLRSSQRDKNYCVRIRNKNTPSNSMTLRSRTKNDTRCSISLSHQRKSIVHKYLLRKNNDTESLVKNRSTCERDDDDNYYNAKLSTKCNNESLIDNITDINSQSSSVLFALLSTPSSSSREIDFTDVIQGKYNVSTVKSVENVNEFDNSSVNSIANNNQLIVDKSVKQEPIILKIRRDRIIDGEYEKERKKMDKRDKVHKRKYSRSVLFNDSTKNERKSTKSDDKSTNANEHSTLSTVENSAQVIQYVIIQQLKDVNENKSDTTLLVDNNANNNDTKLLLNINNDELPKNIVNNNINNENRHLRPKLRFHSKTQALQLGLLEKNQRIINERKGLPPPMKRIKKTPNGKEPKVQKKSTKKNAKKVQTVKGVKRQPGRPRKNAAAAVETLEESYLEYEDGRQLPSLPIIDILSQSKGHASNNDDDDDDATYSITSSETDECQAAIDQSDKIIELNKTAIGENCEEEIADTAAITSSEFMEQIKIRPFGEENRINTKNVTAKVSKKPPIIVDDKILPKGTVNVSKSNANTLKTEDNCTNISDCKRKNKKQLVFTPEIAKKRKILHSSEFNPVYENEINSYGIRSTVPSRQSLLPSKKSASNEELGEKLKIMFKKWAEIPELSEILTPRPPNVEIIKPKLSIKERLGNYCRDHSKNDVKTELKNNQSPIPINQPTTSHENISKKIQTVKISIESTEEINKSKINPGNSLKVQIPSEITRINACERIKTPITCVTPSKKSTIIRIDHKRPLDHDETSVKSKYPRRTYWKQERTNDFDMTSSTDLEIMETCSSSSKYHVKSANDNESSSIISAESLTKRFTEWCTNGTNLISNEIDSISNCHSPSSVKTIVNPSEFDNFEHNPSIFVDTDPKLTTNPSEINEKNTTTDLYDNDDDDHSSNSSSSSCCSSSSSTSTSESTKSVSILSGCVGPLHYQQKLQIHENLNVNEDNNGDRICAADKYEEIVIPDEDNNDEDDDLISLFADPTEIQLVDEIIDTNSLREDDSIYSSSSSHPYKCMRSTNIGRFVRDNAREFDALYNNNNNYDTSNNNNNNNNNNNIFNRISKSQSQQNSQQLHSNPEVNTQLIQHTALTFQQIASYHNLYKFNNNNNSCNNSIDIINVKSKFRGHCYSTLKRNDCSKIGCPFEHKISNKLLFLHMESSNEIRLTLIWAITEKYFHYLKLVYHNSIAKLNISELIEVFSKMLEQKYPNIIREFVNITLKRFSQNRSKFQLFVDCISMAVPQSTCTVDDNVSLILINALLNYIEAGRHWEILRCLILKLAFPPHEIVELILIECSKYEKTPKHIRDIETNIIQRLDENILMKIDEAVIGDFLKLVDNLKQIEIAKDQSQIGMIQRVVAENERDVVNSMSIASPDSIHNNCNVNANDNQNGGRNDGTKLSMKISSDLRSRIGCRKPDASIEWKFNKVDNINKPHSIYKNILQNFHKDFDLMAESLYRKDYDAVIRILEITKRCCSQENVEKYARGFYEILCNSIMNAPNHLQQIIILSVQIGEATAPNILPKMLLNIGVNILKKLIHIEAWIVAYKLLKTIINYYGGQNNAYNNYNCIKTASFVLLSVEIYIANRRPLKAFDMIKHNNLMTQNRNEWKINSKDEDEELRVSILSLLLSSLCLEHVEYAFFMYDTFMKDQKNNFYPIDLSKYTDNILVGILRCGKDDILIEMVDLILEYHLIVSPITIRAVIIKTFHLDQILSRQLLKYASEIGIYPKMTHWINSLAFLFKINICWSEEEMYLMMDEYLRALQNNVGDNLNNIKPRKLIILLNFEIYPSMTQLLDDNTNNDGLNNILLISNAKKLMKNVLERFDPPLKFSPRTPGHRLCRFISYTVINYLKARCAVENE